MKAFLCRIKEFRVDSKKKEIILLSIALILQSVIFALAGAAKSYIHMDEAYSLGLISYEQVEFQENMGFYNEWHTGEYYMDYLVLDEDEADSWSAVYDNQRDDVHPPLYYLLLRVAMSCTVGEYNLWPGIILNMVIYLFVTVVIYLILKKIFAGHDRCKELSLVLAFFSSVSLASVTAVVYLRMYALVTLWVLLTAYLHILLFERGFSYKLLVPIGLVALAGSLTHYYYLFFLFAVCVMTFFGYLRNREWRHAIAYAVTMLLAGGLSLLIFPYSIEHMFFGYRGEGAISKMTSPGEYFAGLWQYLMLCGYGTNNLFFPFAFILVAGFCILIYNKYWRKEVPVEGDGVKAGTLRLLWLPTTFYFIVVSIASPWDALRYIMPVSSLIFILLVYGVYWLTCRITDRRIGERVLCAVLALFVIMPIVSFSGPQELYIERREVLEVVQTDRNLPAVYFYDSDSDRFLDDIYLFAQLDESYVALDVISHDKQQDIGTAREIFEGVDTSDGALLFINGDQLHWVIIDTVRTALGKQQCDKVAQLNACDVYYIY